MLKESIQCLSQEVHYFRWTDKTQIPEMSEDTYEERWEHEDYGGLCLNHKSWGEVGQRGPLHWGAWGHALGRVWGF